ncbi:MAG: hypothetical protein GDA44_13815 [Prochloron sp. SP5CPC1]|nr:hypothetical protein [Candidatus Paraprochloron terpiosi SP5CPC1]
MTTIQIENVPDELYNHIQSLAAEKNLTLNGAVIHLLQYAFQTDAPKMLQERPVLPMSEILQRIRSRTKVQPINFGLPDSTVLIREDRNR